MQANRTGRQSIASPDAAPAKAPWTRAERTREIGYAEAMSEIASFVRELGKTPPPMLDIAPSLPPEAAWYLGAMQYCAVVDRIRDYAAAAYLVHADPAFFGRCAGSLAEGGYGPAPSEPGGAAPQDGGAS